MVQKVARPEGWAIAGPMTAAWLVGTYGLTWLGYHGFESRMTQLRDLDLRGALRLAPPAAMAHPDDRRATIGRRPDAYEAPPKPEPMPTVLT